MKSFPAIFLILALPLTSCSQSENSYSAIEQQTEMMGEREEAEIEDDTFILQLEYFRKHPLNLNQAGESELQRLPMLNGLQIANFLSYRSLLGKFLNIYELQAVPAWDLQTIQTVLPYVTVTDVKNLAENIAERWSTGDHTVLLQYGRVLERAKGFSNTANNNNVFLGSAARLYSRYTYNYKNLLQWGLLGEKDAGEEFFKGSQKKGFDFYSFHLYAARIGIIKTLVVGDFTVNMGQGLVQWQTIAFKKSSDITLIKRQASVLAPYRSAGESGFQRGVGITLEKGSWDLTVFASKQAISTHTDLDSITDEGHFTSILRSGYHRTADEVSVKNNLRQVAAGSSLKFTTTKWHIALNAAYYRFSKRFQKQDLPYNLFAPQGKHFLNSSFDYSYTLKNLHLFGEAAVDKNGHTAVLNGALLALAPNLDLSLVHRSISRSYESINANAFTENSVPSNETGLFAGVSFRPSGSLHIQAYTDMFRFPWLKYRVDAPSSGKEYFIQLTYTPNKLIEITCRYRNELKQANVSGAGLPTHQVDEFSKQSWRFHSDVTLSRELSVRSRCEISRYGRKGAMPDNGFLMFIDCLYKPSFSSWSGNLRVAYFSADTYDSRIYAYENDLMYSFSIPAFFDSGYRYYLNAKFDVSKSLARILHRKLKAEFGIRLAQSIYPGQETRGSGVDEIKGDKKTDLKMQVLMSL